MSPESTAMNPSLMQPWSPDSWRGLPAAQQPVYRDPAAGRPRQELSLIHISEPTRPY